MFFVDSNMNAAVSDDEAYPSVLVPEDPVVGRLTSTQWTTRSRSSQSEPCHNKICVIRTWVHSYYSYFNQPDNNAWRRCNNRLIHLIHIYAIFHLSMKSHALSLYFLGRPVNAHSMKYRSSLCLFEWRYVDRSLTYRQHLECLKAKTTSRVALIRRLAGTTWGAATKTLRISTQALVYSAAEYCAPVWCRSSHTKQLDTVLNSAMRTVAGCLRPTPVNQLPILAGIAPPTIRREAAVLALTRKAAKDEDHILHLVISERPSPARLKSRRPFAEHAHRLLRSTPEDVSSRSWLSTRWNEEWWDAEHSRLHSFINTPDHVPGQDLPRRQWTTYNRIRTGVGRFGEAMKRWGLKSTSECKCGAPNQSVQHIMDDCTMHRPPNGERGLTDLDEDTRIWLASTSLEIWQLTHERRRRFSGRWFCTAAPVNVLLVHWWPVRSGILFQFLVSVSVDSLGFLDLTAPISSPGGAGPGTINLFWACLGAQLTICAQKWRNFVCSSTLSLRFVLSRVFLFLYSLGSCLMRSVNSPRPFTSIHARHVCGWMLAPWARPSFDRFCLSSCRMSPNTPSSPNERDGVAGLVANVPTIEQ